MNVTLESNVENDYLLIKSSGIIIDLEELKLLMKRFYDEIADSGLKKAIIDEQKMQFPISLQYDTSDRPLGHRSNNSQTSVLKSRSH